MSDDESSGGSKKGLIYVVIFILLILGSILATIIYLNKMIDSIMQSDMAYF